MILTVDKDGMKCPECGADAHPACKNGDGWQPVYEGSKITDTM